MEAVQSEQVRAMVKHDSSTSDAIKTCMKYHKIYINFKFYTWFSSLDFFPVFVVSPFYHVHLLKN